MNISLRQHLVVNIKYAYQRANTAYYQRKIPLDLLDRYPGKTHIKINLHTLDPRVIAIKVERLNKEHEAQWAAMRRNPSLSNTSIREEAEKLLQSSGIDKREDGGMAESVFLDKLDQKRQEHAQGHYDSEEAYQVAPLEDYLTRPEAEAVRLMKTKDLFLISDALELYLREHPKRGQSRFSELETYTRRIIDKLIQAIGDKPIEEVTREDAYAFRDRLLAKIKTESAKRNITTVKAVFSRCIAEKSLTIPNVWQKLTIAGLGKDSDKRESFTGEELGKLRGLCRAKDDEIRWLLAMIIDTGARLGEVAGLALEDIRVAGEPIPYLDIRERPWRPLDKSDGSTRKIPLVGESLWGAQRLLESADKGQLYAFPRYIQEGNCETNSPSATLNKFMRTRALPHTVHELRHTMRDRLRDAGLTKDIQDAVGGWGKEDVGSTYGQGYGLQILRDALLRTLPATESPASAP